MEATEETAAAVILGLVIYGLPRPQDPSGAINDGLVPLAPFVEALNQTLADWKGCCPLGLPQQPASLDLGSGYDFYTQIVVNKHRRPETNFHRLLLQHIAAHPVIASTVQWLRAPGPCQAQTSNQEEALIRLLYVTLIPHIEEALEAYLQHHCTTTCGFEAIAQSRKLVPQEDQDVQRVRRRIAQQLVIPLLSHSLPGAAAPAANQTLEVWALRGWVAPGGKLKSVILQALLGSSMDGAIATRRRGAIVQGLMHWYFTEVYRIPFIIDAWVGYVQCPHHSAPVMLPVRAGSPAHLTCPGCQQTPLDFASHRIVAHRQNLAGKELEYEALWDEGALPEGYDDQPMWVRWKLATCPPEHWVETLLGQAAVERANSLPRGPAVLAALAEKSPTQHPWTRKRYKAIGKKLKKVCAGVQKPYAPVLRAEEEERLRQRVLETQVAMLHLPGSVDAAMKILQAFIAARATLAAEHHYFPRSADHQCPLVFSLPGNDPRREGHTRGVGQRRVALYFPIDAGRKPCKGASVACPGQDDRPWQALIPHLEQLYEELQTNPKTQAALAIFGVTAATLHDDAALLAASEKLFPWMQRCSRCRDGTLFEQQEEPELWKMWESLTIEPRPWESLAAFARAVYDVLDTLLDILNP